MHAHAQTYTNAHTPEQRQARHKDAPSDRMQPLREQEMVVSSNTVHLLQSDIYSLVRKCSTAYNAQPETMIVGTLSVNTHLLYIPKKLPGFMTFPCKL